MNGNVLEASGHHYLIITNDSSPANASVTDIVDPDEDKLYCFCGNIDYGEMIGCDGADREAEWFHFDVCVEIDPKAKPEGSRFCERCRLGKDPKTGKKVALMVACRARWRQSDWGCVGKEGTSACGARRDGRVLTTAFISRFPEAVRN